MRLEGFVDGSRITGELRLSPEVCVIGSGAGGAVAASQLSGAGLDVLVVEEGGHYTRRDFRMREDTAYPMLYQEDGGRSTEDLGIAILQGRAVGGTTVVNWTTSFRTPEDVVEHWRARHGIAGFTHADLVPHWEAMEARLNVSPVRLEDTNRNNRLLYDGCLALGYAPELLRRNVRGCRQSGFCGMGCPVDAKQSMLVTCLPDAVGKGAAVLSRCRVDRLEIQGKRVAVIHATLLGADDRTPTGATVRITPKRTIIAGGAINSPALLLRSGITIGGRVGARTFLHPTIAQVGRYKEPVAGFYGAPQSVASHHFSHRGDDVGFLLEAAPLHPMLTALAAPGIGADHAGAMAQLGYFAAHIALMIDGFHPSETGGQVKVRPSGAPILSYELPDRVFRAMRDASKALAQIQLASGAIESMSTHDPPVRIGADADLAKLDAAAYATNRLTVFSAHVMGGCAMNDDPSRGVVRSEDFAVHGFDDLHVVDGSVLPTSLGVNPQLTIYGLSHLVSARLAAKWKAA